LLAFAVLWTFITIDDLLVTIRRRMCQSAQPVFNLS